MWDNPSSVLMGGQEQQTSVSPLLMPPCPMALQNIGSEIKSRFWHNREPFRVWGPVWLHRWHIHDTGPVWKDGWRARLSCLSWENNALECGEGDETESRAVNRNMSLWKGVYTLLLGPTLLAFHQSHPRNHWEVENWKDLNLTFNVSFYSLKMWKIQKITKRKIKLSIILLSRENHH